MSWLPSESFSGAGELRASDSDRERVALVLRQAAGDGRLDFAELEERLDRVLRAKTYDDLQQVTADLPLVEFQPGAAGDSVLPARVVSNEVSAVFKKAEVTGHWLVPSRMLVRSFGAEVSLDLSDAVMPNEVVIETSIALGSLKLTLPEGVAVEFEGGGTVWASRNDKTQTRPGPGVPVVRVRGQIFLGEITARPPRRKWFRRGRKPA